MRLLLLLLAGCQAIFQLDPPPDGPPDGPSCLTPTSGFSTFDTATSAAPCVNFAFPNYDPANLTEVIEVTTGGEVRWTPMGNLATTRGGCIGTNFQLFAPTGVFIEVIQPASDPTEYLEFRAYWDNMVDRTAFGRSNKNLVLVHGHGADPDTPLMMEPFDASNRWWRLRPNSDNTAVLAEVSPPTSMCTDGADWSAISRRSGRGSANA